MSEVIPDPVRPDVIERALDSARAVRARAHAPWSRFRVGAAVVTDAGQVHAGCNVESASFGLTLCAERAALAAWIGAVDPAARGSLRVVAIVTGSDAPTPPCGACRQWISELAPEATVVAEAADGGRATWTAQQLLPDAFGGEGVGGG